MRALTVRQPWAWAIVHGGKDVENRTRNIAGAYRGPVAIHAGLTDATADAVTTPLFDAWRAWWDEEAGRAGGQRGHILGVVDLVNVHADCSGLREVYGSTAVRSAWSMPGHFHLMLANPRPLPRPIAVTGRLGLWTLPDDIAAKVAAQLTEATP